MTLSQNPFPQPLIALWRVHPGDILGEPIQFITRGQWTHAGWLRRDGQTIWECYYPKMRCRPVMDAEDQGIDLFALEGMTPDLAERFERYFDITTTGPSVQGYSIAGLFEFALDLPATDEQNVFCSEATMQSIRKVAPALLPLARCEDYKVSPVDLGHSTRLIGPLG
jgi:hypothetical protein